MSNKWKSIKGYEGLYEAHSDGTIRRVNRSVIKPTKRGEYLKVSLYKNGEPKQISVHRIIAETFIPNPNMLPQVNRKDENKLNNRVSNLEWCDRKYNANYGTAIERSAANHGRAIIGTNVKTGERVRFSTIAEAERKGIASHSHIINCIKGKERRKSTGGYTWEYAE